MSVYLKSASQRYITWKLTDAAQIVSEVAEAILQAQEIKELKELLDEFLIYNNELFVWQDKSIPWSQLGWKIEFIN